MKGAPGAGDLNRRVTIQREQVEPDGAGGQRRYWVNLGTVRCQAISQNGREAVIAGALQGVSAWRVTVRSSSLTRQITANDQLLLGDETLNIRTVADPDGRREWIVMLADTGSVER